MPESFAADFFMAGLFSQATQQLEELKVDPEHRPSAEQTQIWTECRALYLCERA